MPGRKSVFVPTALAVGCFAVSLTCKRIDLQSSHPPVTYDGSAGTVTIPGATILFEGDEYYESAQMADSCLALVVTADSSRYFYSPLQRSLDSLTTATAKMAVLRAMLHQVGAHTQGDVTSETGVELTEVATTRMKFTNPKHRYAMVEKVSPQGENDCSLIPPKMFLDLDLLELVKLHWDDFIKIDQEYACEMDYIRSDPPDTFKFYGSIQKLSLFTAEPGSPAILHVVAMMPDGYLESLLEGYRQNPELTSRLSVVEGVDILYFLVRRVMGADGTQKMTEVLGEAALDTVLGVAQPRIGHVVGNTDSEERLVSETASGLLDGVFEGCLGVFTAASSGTSTERRRTGDTAYASVELTLGTIILVVKTAISILPETADTLTGTHDAVTNLVHDLYVPTVITNQPPDKPDPPSGPTSGEINTWYDFTVVTTDPEGEDVSYQVDFDEQIADWGDYHGSGSPVTVSYSWTTPGLYDMAVRAKDVNGNISVWSDPHRITIQDTSGPNNPPDDPSKPSGPTSGYTGQTYTFSTSGSDPDGDSVQFRFTWGDGSTSNWTSLVPSGGSDSMSYSWADTGHYQVMAQSCDKEGLTSNWSQPLTVAMADSAGPGYPNRVVDTVAVGNDPWGVAALPNGSYVYVTNRSDDSVSVIRTSDNTVVALVAVRAFPQGVAALPNGSYVYVANGGDDNVSVIRTSDNTVVALVAVGDNPFGIAALPNGSYVYVTNLYDNNVSVIRTSDNAVVATVPVGNSPFGAAALPNGSYVYVTNFDDDNVSVIRTSDNTVVATVAVGDAPQGAAALPSGSYVYVATSGDDSVSVIRTSDNTVVALVAVGLSPRAVTALPNGNYVYVTNVADNNVSVIRTSDNTVVASIAVGHSPQGAAALPDGSRVYVTNRWDDTVSVIGF